jgi:hypothetical protein
VYDYRWVNPVDDEDGGQPGGNIRVVFFFRTDVPGLSFAAGAAGGSTDAEGVVGSGAATTLRYNPGRIDPASEAWADSRKPLAGEFLFDGHAVFVIANHFVSKLGDDPLWGLNQPPVNGSETQRHQQAHEVADFVSSLLAADPQANVIALGDLNDFQFSDTVSILKSSGLRPLIDELPLDERYTYVFDGNSQAIDHMLIAGGLVPRPRDYDVVHVNSEFVTQVSDHDPQVAAFTLDAPSASAGPFDIDEGGTTTLRATATDPSGGPVSVAWDLDGNGSYETTEAAPAFSAAALDGPSTRTVGVQVTAPDGATTKTTARVDVANVPPTAAFAAPASVFATEPIELSLTGAADPSGADRAAGFKYAFDCGRGYGPATATATASCATDAVGTQLVKGKVIDKDGGTTEYTATVSVRVTVDSLCAAVTRWAKNGGIATSLSKQLRHGQLGAFRNEVTAQSGKSFTNDQASTLIRLSQSL